MKSILVGERVSNMRVLDTLGCLTLTNNTSEQLTALKHITSKDHVHLTEEGYKAMAAVILKEATSLRLPREKGANKGISRQPTVTWNGFISHSGIGKYSLKATKKRSPAPPPIVKRVDKNTMYSRWKNYTSYPP
jgi:hypothetical protein